jgi:hypothetical protein
MFEFIAQHHFWAAVALYWIFSAAVSSMPDPASNGGSVYLWIYRFLHTVAGNVTKVFGGKIPGAISGFLLTIVLLFTLSSCAGHYTVHPGALNTTDSAAYDALLIAQATIDQARTSFEAGQLPASAKDSLNTLIQSYNIAHDSWLTYRGAIATNVSADAYFAQLTSNILNLTNAIRALRERIANASPTGRSHQLKEVQ